ncbi:hypothetical protein ACFQ14_15080 [Pseudahrensia aquimaris]|uniref:Uncharacterized protein n=1 Tax=Pseudahrensia aquimaris TaxID=744461 RepID=A0ABW3FHZ2_9HYPH
MRTRLTAIALMGLTAFGGLAAVQPSHAQSVTIGNSDQQIARALSGQGYSDIVITKRGFTITTLEACRRGDKFQIKMNILGQIKSNRKIGSCGNRFAARDAEAAMKKAGYTDITASVRGEQVVAMGCRENRQFELTFNLRGDLINRDRQGRCGLDALRPREVRASLRERGYNRIKFIDNELPRYVAEACQDTARVELVINRRGKINRERRIGNCRGPVDPNNIAPVLRQQGYDRVEAVQTRRAPYMVRACKEGERQEIIVSRFGEALSNTKIGECGQPIDPNNLAAAVEKLGYQRVNVLRGNRTPYLVEACKGRDLLELTIGRFGDVKEERVGSCARPLNEADARAKLAEAGYFLPTLERRNNGSWNVEACKATTKVSLRINRFGEFARENKIGSCQSATAYDVLSTLEARGASGVTMYVEGCFRNRTYRWSFDRLGNRTGRERLGGSC